MSSGSGRLSQARKEEQQPVRYSRVRTPRFLRVTNPLLRGLIRAGLPAGVNVLLTVRGRRSGRPRTTPVAIIGIGGRRWIQGAYGEVDWVRNLRDAGEATLTAARRTEAVRAAELNKGEAAAFFAEILTQYLQQAPALVRSILPMVLGVKDAVRDPQAAAERHPVFEIWAR